MFRHFGAIGKNILQINCKKTQAARLLMSLYELSVILFFRTWLVNAFTAFHFLCLSLIKTNSLWRTTRALQLKISEKDLEHDSVSAFQFVNLPV